MPWAWIGFITLIGGFLALDLGVFHRSSRVVPLRQALGWSLFWIAAGLAFCGFVYAGYEHHWLGLRMQADGVDGIVNDGQSAVVKFLTGFVIEKSLSIDNIFVIAMLFGSLAIRPRYQYRVLFWGILGAIAFRGAMIGAGAALLTRYHWLGYLLGGFLIVTAARLFTGSAGPEASRENYAVRWVRRFLPITPLQRGGRFLGRVNGRVVLTPLAVALLAVETTDILFATDSIPAIFAVTDDPFLLFTSNVFALLGMRSLYFVLAGMMATFKYLKPSLAAVLGLVGGKMLAGQWIEQWIGASADAWLLAATGIVLALGACASVVARRRSAGGPASVCAEAAPVP